MNNTQSITYQYFLKGDISGIQDFIFNVNIYKPILYLVLILAPSFLIAQVDSTLVHESTKIASEISTSSTTIWKIIAPILTTLFVLGLMIKTIYDNRKIAKELGLLKEQSERKIDTTKKDLEQKLSLMESEVERKVAVQVENNIGEQSEKYVHKYFAEKLGVKPEVIRSLFRQFEKEHLIKENKRIVVLTNNGGGKVQQLYEFLHDYHEFKNVIFEDAMKTDVLDTNKIDLMLLNNSAKDFPLDLGRLLEIVKIYKGKTKIHYIGSYLKDQDLQAGIDGFTTDKNKLPGNLVDALR